MKRDRNLRRIKLIVMDVDGVLTDGKIILTEDGREIKNFYAQDGLGIEMALKNGLIIAWITGRKSKIVEKRAKELNVKELYQNVEDKLNHLHHLIKKYNLKFSEVAYIGDDVNDLQAMNICGFSFAVYNAQKVVKDKADYICKNSGGNGAVREAINLILKAKE